MRIVGSVVLITSVAVAGLAAPSAAQALPAAVYTAGNLVAWGFDFAGELPPPASLAAKTVTKIVSGYRVTIALTTDGKLTAWGSRSSGPRNIPTTVRRKTVSDVAAANHYAMAATTDGVVTEWGRSGPPVPASLSGQQIVAVAAAPAHALALSAAGTVTAWGDIAIVPDELDGVVVTAIQSDTILDAALTADGRVIEWNATGVQPVPAELTGQTVTTLAIGGPVASLSASVALTSTGSVIAWGAGPAADLPPRVQHEQVTSVATNGEYAIVVRRDRTIDGWGLASEGQTEAPDVLVGRPVAAVYTTLGGSYATVLPVDHIKLATPPATPAGVRQPIAATGYDAVNHRLADVSAKTDAALVPTDGGGGSSDGASCDPAGCTATTPGTYWVLATYANLDGAITPAVVTRLTVTAPPITSVVVPTLPRLRVGASTDAVAIATDSTGRQFDATHQAAWTTTDATVATVDSNGVVTGVGVGTATVSATLGGVSGSAPVTVRSG